LAVEPDSLVTLGLINGVYGVRGWVKIFSFTSPKENILKYKNLRLKLNSQWLDCKVEAGKKHGKGIIAKLEGYENRDLAAKLIKAEIAVSRDELPELPEGEYYWSDLLGLEVVNLENTAYGRVDQMMETGVNDVMVVVKGDKERLIPFIQGMYVKNIDLEQKQIIVDWPEDFE